MAISGSVILQAVDSAFAFPQQWVPGGGAANAQDGVSLLAAGNVFSNIVNDEEYFLLDSITDSIPTDATINDIQFVVFAGGIGTAEFCYNGVADTSHTIDGGNIFTWEKIYADSTPFGGIGAWSRNDLGGINKFGFKLKSASMTISAFYVMVSFSVPDCITPSSVLVAGGTTVTFEAVSGNFIDANYNWNWLDFPSVTNPITVINGRSGSDVSPARSAGPISVSISDPEGSSIGLRPYNSPGFSGVLTALASIEMEFLEDPSGIPTEYAVTGGVTMGSSYMGYLSKDVSGIYTLVADKRNDTVYVRAGSTTTQDVQIPTPFAEFGFVEADDE